VPAEVSTYEFLVKKVVILTTHVSFQFWQQFFALQLTFSDEPKKSAWSFSLFNILLLGYSIQTLISSFARQETGSLIFIFLMIEINQKRNIL
jgi:hypothetical protein